MPYFTNLRHLAKPRTFEVRVLNKKSSQDRARLFKWSSDLACASKHLTRVFGQKCRRDVWVDRQITHCIPQSQRSKLVLASTYCLDWTQNHLKQHVTMMPFAINDVVVAVSFQARRPRVRRRIRCCCYRITRFLINLEQSNLRTNKLTYKPIFFIQHESYSHY